MWMDDRIDKVSKEIEEISRAEENCVNVMTVPGIGPMISTAMVLAIGEGEALIVAATWPRLCRMGRAGSTTI